jgi:hypothetical protein
MTSRTLRAMLIASWSLYIAAGLMLLVALSADVERSRLGVLAGILLASLLIAFHVVPLARMAASWRKLHRRKL